MAMLAEVVELVIGVDTPTQPQVARGIDQPRDQGQQRQRQQQRLYPWRGVRTLRACLHRLSSLADWPRGCQGHDRRSCRLTRPAATTSRRSEIRSKSLRAGE
jgi:hypothetical protein